MRNSHSNLHSSLIVALLRLAPVLDFHTNFIIFQKAQTLSTMHIGFIMDGNRRWATMRNLAKSLGHNAGVRALENTLELCVKNDIKYVSFWALAKKNIEERTKMELDHIYFLLVSELANLTPKMVKNGVKFETVGDTELLPDEVVNAIKSAKESTKHGTKTTCILAIGYG